MAFLQPLLAPLQAFRIHANLRPLSAVHFLHTMRVRRRLSTATKASTSTASLEQLLHDKVSGKSDSSLREEGVVVEKTEGTLTCTGLFGAHLYQPIALPASSAVGIIISLETKLAKVALLSGTTSAIALGSTATLLSSPLSIPSTEHLGGAIISAIGSKINPNPNPNPNAPENGRNCNASNSDSHARIPIFSFPRRKIVDYESITRQLFTRVRAIDTLYPFGAGERIAITGPARSGKRALAADTAARADVDHIVWVSVGQPLAAVQRTVERLQADGVAHKAVVVHEAEGELWGRQWLAPITGLRLAETAARGGKAVLLVVDGFSSAASKALGDARKEVYSHWKQPEAEVLERCGRFKDGAEITCLVIVDTGSEGAEAEAEGERRKDLLQGVVDNVVECQPRVGGPRGDKYKYIVETLGLGNVSAPRYQHLALKYLSIRLRNIMFTLNEELKAVELARVFGIDHAEERDVEHIIEHAENLRAFFGKTQQESFAATFVALVVAANGKKCLCLAF